MRKAMSIFLLLALLAGVLYAYANSQTFILAAMRAGNAAAQIVSPSDAATNNTASTAITGKPTITAAFINQVLAHYRSPAGGDGAALYNLGVQYNINPVYALAFFMHESMFGTLGVARVTLSLGNIRCSAGYACIDGYRAYSSWASGFADWYRLIQGVYVNQWHKTTIQAIIPTYAPAGDHNNPATYITAVERAVSSWQSGKVEVS